MSPQTDVNRWRLANDILTKPSEWSLEISRMEDMVAEDTPIRALIDGWDAAEAHVGGMLRPCWRKLREIDETIFFPCSKRERLAMLQTMYAVLRFHVDPSPQNKAPLPPWYLKREVVFTHVGYEAISNCKTGLRRLYHTHMRLTSLYGML